MRGCGPGFSGSVILLYSTDGGRFILRTSRHADAQRSPEAKLLHHAAPSLVDDPADIDISAGSLSPDSRRHYAQIRASPPGFRGRWATSLVSPSMDRFLDLDPVPWRQENNEDPIRA